ncbi:helix-turn-helix transcriptional regulator [Catellatospora sp. IY07-71]|uniref:helix-turn-helix domain-containing protein n=1 Tax=Catellatospora sp. IY07-71 TaxID=2728827 RepID=UPI001BB32756|nr:helix-turn-helix transcriptional regulator [Catellatospora sp. IY07-71]
MSHRLRSAMLRAQLDSAALAVAVGVDVKTVNRWLAGRIPHQRTRLTVAVVLGENEADLWPHARPDQAPGTNALAEVVGAYAHRADIPQPLWTSLLTGASERIDLLGYAYPFILELLPDAMARIADKIRNALNFLDPLHEVPGCQIGLHTVHLYNSVFRFDDQMIVTPHLFRARGYQHTALHLRRLSPHGIFASFADQFEQIWQTATPYPAEAV